RVYSTAMSTLCLEVYYRYLPLSRLGSNPSAASGPEPARSATQPAPATPGDATSESADPAGKNSADAPPR
ncbi:MAG: hypothetical protein ACKOFW_07900, partial [Planctomycetaceae bacterium]